jgi:DNA-binding transcriptional MerR regulator
MTTYTIGDLSREFGVTLRTLRFYEDKGILSPKRQGTTRIFSRRDRARLKLALLGKKIGFSLIEIKQMLDLYDLRDGQVTQLRFALQKFEEQAEILRRQKEEAEQALQELHRTAETVKGLLREHEAGGAQPSAAAASG